mgnify:CR=1 FL=1
MAKDKKQDRNLAETQKAGRNGEKKTPKPQDIDVRSGSLEEMESDSELDIQALLRKYMPDYDKEEQTEEPAEAQGSVLSKLKNSADFVLDDKELEDFEMPEEEPEPEAVPGFSGLDAAFSSEMPDKALGECDLEFPYQVPDGQVFVLGDNRTTSIDSRSSVVGCINVDEIVGKMFFRVWPLEDVGAVK